MRARFDLVAKLIQDRLQVILADPVSFPSRGTSVHAMLTFTGTSVREKNASRHRLIYV
jgi:hypothetical protein